ncbi:MAG: CaiB/BaiF CoA-transferase family protein, partial [Halobacteria archaeon]|nr:CaiB/BaiF CoA-transferase family protein [Halobacteria archaeon]
DSVLPWLTKQAGKVFAGETPERMGTRDPVLAPYQTYRTKDGHINVACLNQKLWRGLCESIGREDLLDDPRFETNADRVENMEELEDELESTLTQRTTNEWMDILIDAGIPAGSVQSVEDALYNEQTEARGVISTYDHPEHGEIPMIEHPIMYANSSTGFESFAPKLGEHNYEVVRELGYSEDEIDELEEKGVFGGE